MTTRNAKTVPYPSIGHWPCPSCSTPLVMDTHYRNYVCRNQNCPQANTFICVPEHLGVYDPEQGTWTPLDKQLSDKLLATGRYGA